MNFLPEVFSGKAFFDGVKCFLCLLEIWFGEQASRKYDLSSTNERKILQIFTAYFTELDEGAQDLLRRFRNVRWKQTSETRT